jgi:adenosylcobyric acid synthase
MGAASFHALKPKLLPRVMESFAAIGVGRDLVLVEGAGSPAEVNLRAGDLANMGFATEADVPVVLVADIDRGGAIAALVGTHALLEFSERMRVVGTIINKFRGDPALFAPALAVIEGRTGWRGFGILPWFEAAARLPAEDSLAMIGAPTRHGGIRIAIPRLARIANFDDFDPLAAEPDVALEFIAPGRPLPGDADLVILPGSKATIADLAFLRAQGWDVDLAAHHRRGGRILGICAGYQMLGYGVADPGGVEGPPETVPGLGLLDVATVMAADKTLRPVTGEAMGEPVSGYEMHMGETDGAGAARPMLFLEPSPLEGEGRVGGETNTVHRFYKASAPEMISMSSLVIEAWRVRL